MYRSLRLLLVALAFTMACAGGKPDTAPSTRLVDLFPGAQVAGLKEESAPPRQRIEWSFASGAAPAAGPAWDARTGVSGLTSAGKLRRLHVGIQRSNCSSRERSDLLLPFRYRVRPRGA